jgi:diguanylate cyclase (GGDEF)-like protein/PAS domain S-box-containing protein
LAPQVFVIWLLLLQGLAAGSPYGRASLVTFFFPLAADCLFVVAVTMRLLWSTPLERPAFGMVLIAAMAAALGNALLIFARLHAPYVVASTDFEILYTIAVMSMGLGGLLAHPEPSQEPPEMQADGFRTAATVPTIAVGCAAVAGIVAVLRDTPPSVVSLGLASAILGLLAGRQFLSLHENRLLTRGLQQRTRQFQMSEARFRVLVQSSSDIVLVLDSSGVISYSSPSTLRLLERDAHTLVGVSLDSLAHRDDRAGVTAALLAMYDQPGIGAQFSFRIRHRQGTWRTLEAIPTNLLDDSAVRGAVINARDITERIKLEERLRREASHDSLTGLANRTLLHSRVEHALASATRRREQVGMLFLDLDDFKDINDTMGHATGDVLLKTVAERIRSMSRAMDTPARFGGDEFALLVEGNVSAKTVTLLAQRLLKAVGAPITLKGIEITPGASIGIALSAGEATTEELLREADVAMYHAKRTGKRSVVMFRAEMDDSRRASLATGVDDGMRYPTRLASAPRHRHGRAARPSHDQRTTSPERHSTALAASPTSENCASR